MGDELKRAAAEAALALVEPGMRLGLGTGSTAALFVELLAARVADGLRVVGVPTSEATRALAQRLGVPLTTLEEAPELDLAVDGADEVDGALRLIKGGGGALTREKIVAQAARRMVVIADAGKRVERLGAFPLPVEVLAFGGEATRRAVERAAAAAGATGPAAWRVRGAARALTDQGNPLLDLALGAIPDPERLAAHLAAVPGIVEHGLFLVECSTALLAGPGGVDALQRSA